MKASGRPAWHQPAGAGTCAIDQALEPARRRPRTHRRIRFDRTTLRYAMAAAVRCGYSQTDVPKITNHLKAPARARFGARLGHPQDAIATWGKLKIIRFWRLYAFAGLADVLYEGPHQGCDALLTDFQIAADTVARTRAHRSRTSAWRCLWRAGDQAAAAKEANWRLPGLFRQHFVACGLICPRRLAAASKRPTRWARTLK